jgi:hypothetical protein
VAYAAEDRFQFRASDFTPNSASLTGKGWTPSDSILCYKRVYAFQQWVDLKGLATSNLVAIQTLDETLHFD